MQDNYRRDLNATLKRQKKILGGKTYQVEKDISANMQKSTRNREILIQSVLPMVEKEARYYDTVSPARVELNDLISAGNMGAVTAADMWLDTAVDVRIAKNAKFSTMAYNWIIKYIKEEINERKSILSHGTTKSYEAAKCYVMYGDKPVGKDGSMNNTLYDILIHDNLTSEIEDSATNNAKEFSVKLFNDIAKIDKRILFAYHGIDCNRSMNVSDIASLLKMSRSDIQGRLERAIATMTRNAKTLPQDSLKHISMRDIEVSGEWRMTF